MTTFVRIRFAMLTLVMVWGGCQAPPPRCPVRADDEQPLDAKLGDACHRAGVNLATACPRLWRKDWDDFCHAMARNDVPLCPNKLAKVKSCAEADEVCR